jgi:hypothetical protein
MKIKQLREAGSEILCGRNWVYSNLTFRKCWQDESDGVLGDVNAKRRLIILHVRSTSGFLQNAELIYKAGNSTGDYHGQMNHVNFEKWVRDKLIPSLPTNSVAMDNAPYHSVQVDKVSSKYYVKTEILAWLLMKGISCDEKMRKQELVSLVAANKPREKKLAE